jgi:uncharacterized protein
LQPFLESPSVLLLAEGGVLLTDSSALVVADVHLGKSAAFRARGLPVPEGDNARDFLRLTTMVRKYDARHLIIAGDLFHAPSSITPELESALKQFLTEIAIPVTLVVGNHDTKISRLPRALTCVSRLDLAGLSILHDPAHRTSEHLHLAGHWHPVVKISEGTRTSLRLPCFLFRQDVLVLPAFGSFTGGEVLKPMPDDRIFVTLREAVVEIPSALIC